MCRQPSWAFFACGCKFIIAVCSYSSGERARDHGVQRRDKQFAGRDGADHFLFSLFKNKVFRLIVCAVHCVHLAMRVIFISPCICSSLCSPACSTTTRRRWLPPVGQMKEERFSVHASPACSSCVRRPAQPRHDPLHSPRHRFGQHVL